MPEKTADKNTKPEIRRRYRGRIGQVQIYLGKLLRMFLYQNDWMVLPMAALVAGLVGIVIRWRMFYNMEGTLISSRAITPSRPESGSSRMNREGLESSSMAMERRFF